MYGLGRDVAGGELANRERCDIVVKNSLRHANGYALTKFAFRVMCSKKNEKHLCHRKKADSTHIGKHQLAEILSSSIDENCINQKK